MARVYKKYKDYTREERQRYVRLGERPFTDSKKSTTNIRSKDDKKGTTGTTVNTKANKDTRASNRNYKRPRLGGDGTTNKKGDYINPKLLPIVKTKPYKTTKKFVPKDEVKKDKKDKSNIGIPAVIGASILAARKLTSKPKPTAVTKVKPKPRPTAVTKVKPRPTAVTKVKPRPTSVTKVKPRPTSVTKVKPIIGTKTPAQDKVRALRSAARSGQVAGPNAKDLLNAKNERAKIKNLNKIKKLPANVKTPTKPKPPTVKPKPPTVKPKPPTVKPVKPPVASKTILKKIKDLVTKGKKDGLTKSAIKEAIKRAVPGAATLAAKVGSRFIPVVGWGLLAYDAARIGKALKGSKLTKGKDDVFGDGVGFKYGGKIPKTMKKGGKMSYYSKGGTVKKSKGGMIKRAHGGRIGIITDTPNGNDFVTNIYDT